MNPAPSHVAGAWRGALAVLAGLTFLAAAPAARAESLSKGLRDQAPVVMKYLQDQKYQNVGVLKFKVKKGDKASDHVGTINLMLATRLQTALLLADDPNKPVALIRDASEVAEKIPGANHTTKEGRQALFAYEKYPLLWGDETVKADAFVCGMAAVRPDLKTMVIQLGVFDRDANAKMFDSFVVAMDPNLLIESGGNFRLRLLMDVDGKVKEGPGGGTPTPQQKKDAALEDARQQSQPEGLNPLEDASSPVALEVCYDGVPQKYEFKGGEVSIAEPREKQTVHLVLRKKDKADVRYGVVVKVNGENTLFHQRDEAARCRKWILSNQDKEVTIRGFNVDNQEAEEFLVRSPEESKALEFKYGKDVGQISIVVFRERTGKEVQDAKKGDKPPADLPKDEEPPQGPGAPPKKPVEPVTPQKKQENETADLAVDLGLAPAQKEEKSLEDAQRNIKGRASQELENGKRGVFDGGDNRIGQKIIKVEFKPDPEPIMLATITYYRPTKPGK